MRPVDVAGLEYREAYIAQEVPVIVGWAQAHAPSTYAGYYVDHQVGGVIHVGFTENQAGQLEALKAGTDLMAPGQVQTFPATPTRSVASLETTLGAVSHAVDTSSQLAAVIVEAGVNEQKSTVEVGATDATTARQLLSEMVGSSAPITVEQRTGLGEFTSGPYQTTGRIKAGFEIQRAHTSEHKGTRCTAGPVRLKPSE